MLSMNFCACYMLNKNTWGVKKQSEAGKQAGVTKNFDIKGDQVTKQTMKNMLVCHSRS